MLVTQVVWSCLGYMRLSFYHSRVIFCGFSYDCIFWQLQQFQEILPVITLNSRGPIKDGVSYESPFETIFSCFQIIRVDKKKLSIGSLVSVKHKKPLQSESPEMANILKVLQHFYYPLHIWNSVIGPWRNRQRQWIIILLPSLLAVPSKPSFLLNIEIDINTFFLIYMIEDWWGS